jgi:hypothetical protein
MTWKNILKEDDGPDASYGISIDALKDMDWVKHMRKVLNVPGYKNMTEQAINDGAEAYMRMFEQLVKETSYEKDVKERGEELSESTRRFAGEKDVPEPEEGKVGRGMIPKRQEYKLKTINRMIQKILEDLMQNVHAAWDRELLDEEDEEEVLEMLEDKKLDDGEIEEIIGEQGFLTKTINESLKVAIKTIGEVLNIDSDTPLNTSVIANNLVEDNDFKSWIAHVYVLVMIQIQTGLTRRVGSEREQRFGDILTEEEEKFFESIDEGGEEMDIGPFKVRGGAEIDPSTGIPRKTASGEDILYPQDEEFPEDWQKEHKMEFNKAWDIIKSGRCKGCRPKRGILGEFR